MFNQFNRAVRTLFNRPPRSFWPFASVINARSRSEWPLPCPSLLLLLRMQATARFRRVAAGFVNPRRLALSCLAAAVGLLWLCYALTAIMFREAADPEQLARFIPLGLMGYAAWHMVKTTWRRPEAGVNWSGAEVEMLCTGPFTRRQLLQYRFGGVVLAAALKSAVFVLLLLPDLPSPVTAFAGACLALIFLECWRMAWDIIACGVNDRVYLAFRWSTLIAGGCLGAAVLASVFATEEGLQALATPGSVGLLGHLVGLATEFADTPLGGVLLAPFAAFSHVILGEYSTSQLGWLMEAGLLTALMALATTSIDGRLQRRLKRSEQTSCPRPHAVDRRPSVSEHLPAIPWLGGAACLAWRQRLGANQYAGSLMVALIIPAFLSCLPLSMAANPQSALLNVVGALVFYTFLLLPPALRLDFRRDLDRMVILKSLPVRPMTTVAGQLATPVCVTTIFQLMVLLLATLVRPIPLGSALTAMLLLTPLNVLIFSLENLLYLLYPHRLNEESVRIFLRATLTFTAKGGLMAGALAMIVTWLIAAKWIASQFAGVAVLGDCSLVTTGGLALILCTLASVTTYFTARAFVRFDPGQDVPG